MKIKDSVFGSAPERGLYKALESAWPDRITLYHNLPFRNVIDISGARLSRVEIEFLNKTSVDYTACEKDSDRPLLSVEFDGLGHGYSHNAQYIEWVGGADPYRSTKMNLKLRLADQVDYPLFVVSYEEAKPITPEDELTVGHAIIGMCLSHMHQGVLLQEWYEEERASLDHLPTWERDDALQDMVLQAETMMDMEWNPLARAAAEAMGTAHRTGLVGSFSWEYLDDPPLPDVKSLVDIEGLRRRIEAMKKRHRVGARFTVDYPGGSVTREAWIRHFTGWGVSGLSIAADLAELLGYRAFLKQVNEARNAQGGPQPSPS